MEGVVPFAPAVRRRNDKGRRSWSAREEEVLLSGLKEIIANGWKSENGFRVGYLQALEAYMGKEFPGTDLKATPHINSKIHAWKKSYGSLFSMLSKSGIGWNSTTKMIESTDEAWDAYLKVDISAKLMRFKSWPFYEHWCDIFGRDRATGLEAEGFADAVNKVLHETNRNESSRTMQDAPANGSNVFDGLDLLFAEADLSADNMSVSQPAISVSQPAMSSSSKKSSGKKRKADEIVDPICQILGTFCANTDARLGEIAKRVGHDYDMACARKEVWSVVEKIDELSLKEKLLASKLLVASTEDMVLWFTLPPDAREEFVRMKLSGHL